MTPRERRREHSAFFLVLAALTLIFVFAGFARTLAGDALIGVLARTGP